MYFLLSSYYEYWNLETFSLSYTIPKIIDTNITDFLSNPIFLLSAISTSNYIRCTCFTKSVLFLWWYSIERKNQKWIFQTQLVILTIIGLSGAAYTCRNCRDRYGASSQYTFIYYWAHKSRNIYFNYRIKISYLIAKRTIKLLMWKLKSNKCLRKITMNMIVEAILSFIVIAKCVFSVKVVRVLTKTEAEGKYESIAMNKFIYTQSTRNYKKNLHTYCENYPGPNTTLKLIK